MREHITGALEPVLLLGIPSEPPLEMVSAELERRGIPSLTVNQRDTDLFDAELLLEGPGVAGSLQVGDYSVPLEAFGGIYTRLMDHRLVPECPEQPDDERHWATLHEILSVWCEIAPARVVNRLASMASNSSKPYQQQIIARYFNTPDTLVTNSSEEAEEFLGEHPHVVYKSISGNRSIVQEMTDADRTRLVDLQTCPVQFQERIDGKDVRVHTVEPTSVIATAVESGTTDYRYSQETSAPAALTPYELDEETAEACLELSADLGLAFAGLDLRICESGEVYCFEVNPSPAYSYYEEATGQPIAAALASYLTGTA